MLAPRRLADVILALSVRMLGEIMNQRPEQFGRGRGIRPALKGRIEFDKVTLDYQREVVILMLRP